MSRLPPHADTRLELVSSSVFDWDARDRSLLARTGHLLTHTRASNSLITSSAGTAVEITHSALGWSVVGGAVGLRVDPAAGSVLLPGSDPVTGRQGDAVVGAIGTVPPADGSGLVRCQRAAWMDLAGTLVDAYLLGVAGANPRMALYALAASRTLRIALIDGSGDEVGAEAAIPAGDVLAIAWQWRLLGSAPAVRLDVGAGFGAWSTATTNPIPNFGSSALRLGDAAHAPGSRAATGLCRVRLVAGHLTRTELLEGV